VDGAGAISSKKLFHGTRFKISFFSKKFLAGTTPSAPEGEKLLQKAR